MSDKSRFLNQHNNKVVWIIFIPNFSYASYKTCWHIWSAKKKKTTTGNINSKVIKTKNGRLISLSKCAVSGSKKSRFM